MSVQTEFINNGQLSEENSKLDSCKNVKRKLENKKVEEMFRLSVNEDKLYKKITKNRMKDKAIKLWIGFNIIFVSAVSAFYILTEHEMFSTDTNSFAVFFSAFIAINGVLFTMIYDRISEVKENTLNALNRLDMDQKYWKDAADMIDIIKSIRVKCLNNKFKDLNYCSGNCSHFLTKDDLDRVDYRNVLRRMEWLCEGIIRGFYDKEIISQRKGDLIYLIYISCYNIICDRVSNHNKIYKSIFVLESDKKSSANEDTEDLSYVYFFLRSYMHERYFGKKPQGLCKFMFILQKVLGLSD